MVKLIINAAMVPNTGTYFYRRIAEDEAVAWLREHGAHAVSYVGYQQTAEHITMLSGIAVPLNCAKCTMEPGDEALVVKLAYRIANPVTKGQPQAGDWEYGLLRRLRRD